MVPVFTNFGERSTAKNCRPVSFRSPRSTADLLAVVSDRIARAFNWSGATRAVALDIAKAFDRVCMLVFFTNLSLMLWNFRSDIWSYFFFSQ